MAIKSDLSKEGAGERPSYWTDLKLEMGRKASDVVADRFHQHGEGEISERELRLIVDAVFDTLNGLAPRDVTEMLYAARNELSLDR